MISGEGTGGDEAPISIVFGDETQQNEPFASTLPEEDEEDEMEEEQESTVRTTLSPTTSILVSLVSLHSSRISSITLFKQKIFLF
jgi:hypothetical protein